MKAHRRKFTPEEDQQLRLLVEENGAHKWDYIAASMPGRTGRQCRDRYQNYLCPGISRDEWTQEEERLLLEKHAEYGPQWAKISKFFQGRTEFGFSAGHEELVEGHGVHPHRALYAADAGAGARDASAQAAGSQSPDGVQGLGMALQIVEDEQAVPGYRSARYASQFGHESDGVTCRDGVCE